MGVQLDLKGYQKTEIGVIPKDWCVKRLKDIAEINKESLKGNTDKEYKFYYYDLSSVNKGKLLKPTEKIQFKNAPSRARRVFKRNNILMSTVRPYLQGFAYIDFESDDCICSTGFAVISGERPSDIKYIYHNLFSYTITNQIQRLLVGSNYPAINTEDVENLKIPYPNNKNERAEIASILSTWDKAIELKEKLIEQKKQQKKGLMQKLLTGEVRLPGYSGEWKKVKLGEILKERKETGYTELELLAITSSKGVVKRTEVDIKDNSSEDKSKYKRILPNDIGYNTMRMWQGVSGVSKYEGIVSPAYTILKPTNKVNSNFIGYLFKLPKIINLFRRYSQGLVSDTLNLKYENLKGIKVTIPQDVEEQKKIAEILLSIDNEIEMLQEYVNYLKQQKKGLMQLLLTGKVRVKV
ncbi:restriction endonuclease subunit S [Heyndrickxia coagulans]|uniref:restriction endonuclease subunit S n=1 Tax=Heyndrickxia coagulans TaxID=1398 RepID=UPI002E207509|nr:restriction endonuclease subunit S [Heyndrickxia coagulans]